MQSSPAASSPIRKKKNSNLVTLNVGGTLFRTTRTTLCADRESLLYRMFCRRPSDEDVSQADSAQDTSDDPFPYFDVDVDDDGHIFIDCDPVYFSPLLNFLRLNEVVVPPEVSAKGVLAAAQYFNVQGVLDHFNRDKRQVIFSWGTGGSGELGTLDRTDVLTPTIVNILPYHTQVRAVALGANYSCVLASNGQVVTFGNGDWGQLGLGPPKTFYEKTDDKMPIMTVPTVVPKLEKKKVKSIATGYAYAMALTEDHEVYFWGNNNHGQSGLGAKHFGPALRKIEEPEVIPALQGKRIIELGCGSFFVIALSDDGLLYSWGLVDCLGQGPPDTVRAENASDEFAESISRDKRTVLLTPRRVLMPTDAAGRFTRINAGQWHSCAITSVGELYTWGVGFQGRLGHGSKDPCFVPTKVTGPLENHQVLDVSCGSFHTVALTRDGSVFCWGDNANGQCGSSTLPEAVTKPYHVLSLGVVGGGFAKSISCGRQHTAVVMVGPHAWCDKYCCRLRHDGKPQAEHSQVYVFGESKGMGLGTSDKVCAAKLVPGMEAFNVNRVVSGLHHMFVITEVIPSTDPVASPATASS